MIINGNLKFHTLGSGELQNAVIENLTTAQRTGLGNVSGQMVYDTDTNSFFYNTGSAWTEFSTGGDVSGLQTEVDAIETASGGIFDTDGSFGSSAALSTLNGLTTFTGLTGSSTLITMMTQLDTAINSAIGIDTIPELTDVVATATSGAIDGDIFAFNGSNWDNTGFTALATNDLLQWNGSDWTNIVPSSIGGNAYETILTDVGTSIVADAVSDTASILGGTNGGIQSTAALDAITLDLTPVDLATTAATLAGGDFIVVSDSTDGAGTVAQKTTFTKVLTDLDIVTAAADGVIVRTAADTYASRTLTASAVAGDEGISIVDGDGVSGNPTIGLDVLGLTAEAGTPSSSDLIPFYDGTNNVKVTLTQLSAGLGSILDFGGLNNVTDGGVSGNVVYADSASTWAAGALGATSDVQQYGAALDDINVIGVTTAADQLYYSTGAGTLALGTITSAGRALVDDATVGDQRTTLGLVAGGTGDIWIEKAGDSMDSAANITFVGGGTPTGLSAITVGSTDATSKAYVDSLVAAGASWKNPVVDSDLVDVVGVNPATPEASYSLSVGDNVSFISTAAITFALGTGTTVVGTGAGDIVNLTVTSAGNGDYTLIETPLSVGDRFIIAGEHGTIGTGLSTIHPGDTFDIVNGDLIEFVTGNGSNDSDWSAPDGRSGNAAGGTEISQGTTVLNADPDSVHYGHTYLYDAVSNAWVEISGPGSVGDGAGLSYSGNVLNVNFGAGIQNSPSDEVGIELFDAATSALILTSSGTDRTALTGSTLHLLLGTNGGLEQDVNGLRVDVDNTTAATIVAADALLFADADNANVASKTTVTNFLADLNIATTSSGGALTASNGVELTTNDFAVSIDSLTNTNAVVGADLLIFDDGAAGTNGARTFANLLNDLDVVNTLGGNGVAVQTAADTYTARSVAASAVAGDEGISVVNGDGVAGNMTVGLDVTGLTAEAGSVSQTDELPMYDGTNNVKVTVAQLATAIGGVTSTDELEDVTAAATVAGQVMVSDGSDYTPRQIQFVDTQASSTSWTVTHNLNQKFVNVTIYDSSDSVIIPQAIVATSVNVTTITFNTAVAGTAVVMGVYGLAAV